MHFRLTRKSYFKWYQLIHAIPRPWKLAVLNDKGNCKNVIYLNHRLINNNQVLAIEKLVPKELYSLSIVLKNERPKNISATFSPIYRLNGKRLISYYVKFQQTPIYVCANIKYWTIFYILISSFLFLIKKILNCVLTVCRLQDETTNHIFAECKFTIKLWSDLRHYCQCSLDLPILNPQSATLDSLKWILI